MFFMRSHDAPGYLYEWKKYPGWLICATCYAAVPGLEATEHHNAWHDMLDQMVNAPK